MSSLLCTPSWRKCSAGIYWLLKQLSSKEGFLKTLCTKLKHIGCNKFGESCGDLFVFVIACMFLD